MHLTLPTGMGDATKYVLRITNKWNETYYFVKLGLPFKNMRLIEQTTTDIAKAAVFDTFPGALAVLKEAGDPLGWEASVIT